VTAVPAGTAESAY